ncbi:hypothetical protein [Halostreptopolyspora alba]|uniref:Bifunctional folylpolyglutamate synthase/dihydrofolate synthase n=1 Tax=Halostreptopolyspora alba TaxID=2487137 RepID=A0A3N0EI28_9ACTN|nr:hypothetical protein EFW17_00420 [Nocardiopsaceae bacterium YIM 96095]
MPSTDVFFREWRDRRAGARRSLARAAELLRELDLTSSPGPETLGVVGSKGKGTTATHASAHLAAAGLRVVTVTGPSFRGHRERVRVNGVAASDTEISSLAGEIDTAIRGIPDTGDGYLAPSGLFLIAGLLRARQLDADACVLEAGMGGRGDELRLVGPRVVAMASVFAEHVGVLGDTVTEIAEEKAGVAGPTTRAFVRLPQSPEVSGAVDRTVREVTGGRTRPETVHPPRPDASEVGVPHGLSAAPAHLGGEAAGRLLRELGRPPAEPDRLATVLSSVRLPARLSHHRVPGTDTEVIVDSAINGTGVAAAVAHARRHWAAIDHVLLCLPDHKDVDGAATALGSLPVTAVRLPESHLGFSHDVPAHWSHLDVESLSPEAMAALGGRVLVLGTVYFTGRVLELVDADTERLFTA